MEFPWGAPLDFGANKGTWYLFFLYLYVPEAKWFFMLDVYGKDEKDDLTAAEKRVLSELAGQLKATAKERCRPKRKGKK